MRVRGRTTSRRERPRILVIDDNQFYISAVTYELESKYDVKSALNPEQGIETAASFLPDLALVDILMPGHRSGIEIVKDLRRASPLTIIATITAFPDFSKPFEAGRVGADVFLLKDDIGTPDTLLAMVASLLAAGNAQTDEESERFAPGIRSFCGMIGESEPMLALYRMIQEVAATDACVLITGESGAGKDLAARAVHRCSARRNAPFCTLNCASFSTDLMESELFGHKAGAFTGATSDRMGMIRTTDGGTVFLDEVGTLGPGAQAKLLRFIEDKRLRPVGSDVEEEADVRLIAATNADLADMVSRGAFRKDLLFRLSVLRIDIPSLRERTEDLPLLAQHFLAKYCVSNDSCPTDFSPQALDLMCAYSWPGNVRELDAVVIRAMLHRKSAMIGPDDVRSAIEAAGVFYPNLPTPESGIKSLAKVIEEVERYEIIHALKENGNDFKKSALSLKIHLSTLYKKISKYGISNC